MSGASRANLASPAAEAEDGGPGRRRDILSSLFTRDPAMDVWSARADVLPPDAGVPGVIAALLRRAPRYRAVVLDGSARRDQLAAVALRLGHPRIPLVIADSTWKRHESAPRNAIDRLSIRLIDGPRTTFCVHSTYELETFPRTWGPLRGRTWFTPWAWTLKAADPGALTSEQGRVFAGGDSLRDYAPLVAAAAEIRAPIDIATTVPLAAFPQSRAPNLTIGPLSGEEYDARLFAASVVVVPLQGRPDRSSGQTTYVNAMALGKAIVVTDTPGVRDYVTDGETGLIVAPGDPIALAQAVGRLLDDDELRHRLGARARAHALAHLSLADYARAILAAVDAPVQ